MTTKQVVPFVFWSLKESPWTVPIQVRTEKKNTDFQKCYIKGMLHVQVLSSTDSIFDILSISIENNF